MESAEPAACCTACGLDHGGTRGMPIFRCQKMRQAQPWPHVFADAHAAVAAKAGAVFAAGAAALNAALVFRDAKLRAAAGLVESHALGAHCP